MKHIAQIMAYARHRGPNRQLLALRALRTCSAIWAARWRADLSRARGKGDGNILGPIAEALDRGGEITIGRTNIIVSAK